MNTLIRELKELEKKPFLKMLPLITLETSLYGKTFKLERIADYNFYEHDLTVILFEPTEVVGETISILTNAPIVHCSIVQRDNTDTAVADFYELGALPSYGVELRGYVPDKNNSERIYIGIDSKENVPDFEEFYDKLESKKYEGRAYELFKFLLPKWFKKLFKSRLSNKGYFCSELVLSFLKYINILHEDIDEQAYTPNDLLFTNVLYSGSGCFVLRLKYTGDTTSTYYKLHIE